MSTSGTCEKCGKHLAGSRGVFPPFRWLPVLIFGSPLADYCDDCAGYVNLVGILFLVAVLALAFIVAVVVL